MHLIPTRSLARLPSRAPVLTVVVPVRDRPLELARCLRSLEAQVAPPPFEVVVVDDGSLEPIAERAQRRLRGFAVRVVRQIALGIPAARNLGLREARSDAVLFLDSDCVASPSLLATLVREMQAHPRDVAFQLALEGDRRTLVGRLEDARLRAVLEATSSADGYTLYANTSGFALRRQALGALGGFDPALVRGEDTALLADLCRRGARPRLVRGASARHAPALSPGAYVARHLRIGYRGQAARERLARVLPARAASVDRAEVLSRLWRCVRTGEARGAVLGLLATSHALERVGRAVHVLVGRPRDRQRLLMTGVDAPSRVELVARILDAAAAGRPLSVTYLTAWTVVQAYRDPAFADRLSRFDIVYPDGMGVVLALGATRLRRSRKVTADDFFAELCAGAALRRLRVALVGARPSVVARLARQLRADVPDLDLVLVRSGYIAAGEEDRLEADLERARPQLLLLGMGQPLQEEWAARLGRALPSAVIHCVGGLFDIASGETRRPPRLVRRCGLEWLHRLLRHPGALWRRYLLGLPMLALLCAADVLDSLRGRREATAAAPQREEAPF